MRISRIATTAALFGTLLAAEACSREPPPAESTGIESIHLNKPNPYGEIPYERDLKVNKYSMRRLRDIHTRQTGDVIATLYTTFSVGEGENADTQPYVLQLTEENERSAEMIGNNLSRCNVFRITNFEYKPDGNRTDTIRVVPIIGGIVYRMPASRVACSDNEDYNVKTKMEEKKGTIDNNGVKRPWLSENQQQLEKPCIPDEPYKSPCAVPGTKSAPASKPAQNSRPTPASKPKDSCHC